MESKSTSPSDPERSLVYRLSDRVPRQTLLLLLALAINIILVAPSLTPQYSSINAFDEAKYIESGRLLLAGEVRNLVWGPLVALAYAPFHLIFGGSPDWFLLDAWGGSCLLFAFMWLSFYHLGSRFPRVLSPHAMIGVMFVTSPLFDVLSNPSDALFVGLSALALAKLLDFRNLPTKRSAATGSTLVALAALARFEAIALLPVYLLLIAIFSRRRRWSWSLASAAFLPAILCLSLYIGVARLSAGSLDLGIAGKSYESFEMNQPLPDSEDNAEQRQRTRELFGTREENQGSVLRAALRNPPAFGGRILANALDLPGRFLDIYGKRLGPVVLALAALGLAAFVLESGWIEIAVFAVWGLQAGVSLVFLPLHFLRQLAYLPLLLAAAGASRLAARDSQPWIRPAAIAGSFAVGIYGLLDHKLALTTAGLVLGFALIFVELAVRSEFNKTWDGQSDSGLGLALLLAAGLILRAPYRFPDFPEVGQSERELAVHALQDQFTPGTRILEPLPLPAVAAKLQRYPLSALPSTVTTPAELNEWLQDESVEGIYVEGNLADWGAVGDLLEADSGVWFPLIYESNSGFIRIYSVKQTGQ